MQWFGADPTMFRPAAVLIIAFDQIAIWIHVACGVFTDSLSSHADRRLCIVTSRYPKSALKNMKMFYFYRNKIMMINN